jgi:hypothetical protein
MMSIREERHLRLPRSACCCRGPLLFLPVVVLSACGQGEPTTGDGHKAPKTPGRSAVSNTAETGVSQEPSSPAASVTAAERKQQPNEVSPLKAEFARAVEEIKREQMSIEPWPARSYIDYWGLSGPAARLARIAEKDAQAVDFLYNRAHQKGDPVAKQLAMITLANIGSEQWAETLFDSLVTAPNQLHWGALMITSYLPREQARAMLEQRLEQLPGLKNWSWGNIPHVAHLAAVLGDAGTLEKLKALRQRLNEHSNFHAQIAWALNYPIRELELRLALPEEQQVRRRQNELLLWQTLNQTGIPNLVRIPSYEFIPQRLMHRGLTIDADFLLEQLENFPEELVTETTRHLQVRMAVALLASQHDSQLIVQHFGPLTKEPHPEAVRKQARRVLLQAQLPAAARILEELLSPDAEAQSNRDIADWLWRHGDRDSLNLLERLARDDRYSAGDREKFRQAAMQLRRRLDRWRQGAQNLHRSPFVARRSANSPTSHFLPITYS